MVVFIYIKNDIYAFWCAVVTSKYCTDTDYDTALFFKSRQRNSTVGRAYALRIFITTEGKILPIYHHVLMSGEVTPGRV